MNIRDLSNERFGKLVAISYEFIDKKVYWTCRCDCGGEVKVRSGDLRSGHRKSCGCLQPGRKDHDDRKNKVLALLKEHPDGLRVRRMMEILGCKDLALHHTLRGLEESGVAFKHGEGTSHRWFLKEYAPVVRAERAFLYGRRL